MSALIPVYNAEDFLGEAIDSVLAQTYEAIELIVVDDGSTDGTPEMVDRYGEARYVRIEHAGVAAARNEALSVADGEFVAFLDADDLWDPAKLAIQVAYLNAHPDVAFTLSRFAYFREPGSDIPGGFNMELLDGDHVGQLLSTIVARANVFVDVGNFRTDLTTAEDVNWFARANGAGVASAVVPDVLLRKRVHASNLSLTSPENNANLLRALRDALGGC